ncbi:probable RNA-binding protein CG14230 [Phymastichus coffea]|uniref:probable RNA-binding protein CG14230 n=1 Tax=Phymastichus coffea TaxID=108790 RepID=UPI00273B5B3E|nr:probable RNA-binding protein CG14230 [Phymastichus coffea]
MESDLQVSVPKVPINESEKKRLMSLKVKKKAFKAQGKVISNALKLVDDTKLNKKIIFNYDMDNEVLQENSKQKNTLFESDNEEQNEFEWNEDELESKANTKRKLLKMQTNIGNDKRFILDERFLDDDEEITKESNSIKPNDDAVFDEKKWQLDILGQVLGMPVTISTAISNNAVQKKKKMIRYDPTVNDHKKYEVTIKQPKEEKSKKKKKKNIPHSVQKEDPLPNSNEIYYDVSENLADSFKPDEGFSLLKVLGRNDVVISKKETEHVKQVKENEGRFEFNFCSKNPFKYDSSDDEGRNEKGCDDYSFKLNTNNTSKEDERLFTPLSESRIEELNKFFNTPLVVDEEAFKRRRRELKKIVRTKIRNNIKKATPWKKKKVWKQKKKQ